MRAAGAHLQRRFRRSCSVAAATHSIYFLGAHPHSVSTDAIMEPLSQGSGLESLAHTQRCCDRLVKLLGTLQWPACSQFQAFGETYQLPIRSIRGCSSFAEKDGSKVQACSSQQLEYAAGFFDGDGCVSVKGGLSGCVLSITQSANHGEAAVLFYRLFGGGIYIQSSGIGPRQPKIQWMLQGSSVRHVAAKLAPFSCVKQAQLFIAAKWPTSFAHRSAEALEIKKLKREPCSEMPSCTWAYVAGFFDAEGCISISQRGAVITLAFTQHVNNKAVLVGIQRFLRIRLPQNPSSITTDRECHVLHVSSTAMSRAVLNIFLSSGLLVKQASARAALSLEHVNHASVRNQMEALTGNQSRYKRLDSDGCQRAVVISRLNCRLYRLRSKEDVAAGAAAKRLHSELTELRQLHVLENAKARLSKLRHDIRILLRHGARPCQIQLS
ncbi:unnamed protein product, partial [Polarella glacialis]